MKKHTLFPGEVLKTIKFLSIFIIFVGIVFPLFSASIPPEFRFKRYFIDDGLSQSIVECIIQDRRGFLWFGTEDGLNRFDGYTFDIIRSDPTNPSSISHSNITALLEDRMGKIWIGTFNGGLNRYDPETGEFTHFIHSSSDPKSISHDFIRALYEDMRGNIWIGTSGGGLNLYNQSSNTFTIYRHDPQKAESISHNSVSSILEDKEGQIWVGTDGGGLNLLNQKSGSFFHYRAGTGKSVSSDQIHSLIEDRKGRIWIGTYGGGLNRLEKRTGTFTVYCRQPGEAGSISHDQVHVVYEDRKGRIWAGTNGGGLNLYDEERDAFHHYQYDPQDPSSISYNEIRSIAQDEGGVLWIGTYGGGICKFDGNAKPFHTLRHIQDNPDSLSHDIVWAIHRDKKGRIWAGTHGGGLDMYDPKKNQWKHFRNRPGDTNSLSDNRVRVIFKDPNGIFWIGTNGGGLNRFDPDTETFKVYKHNQDDPFSLSHNEIRAICRDRFGKLWIGTHGGGLNEFDPETGKFIVYKYDPGDPGSISNDIIRALYVDHSGRLWIGTHGGGLNLHNQNDNRFSNYQVDPTNPFGFPSNYVFSILQDQSGDFWLGTWDGGLVRFNPETKQVQRFSISDGLPSNSIYCILQDKSGDLWLSSNNGLSRFNPESKSLRNYTMLDGLQSNEFNGGASFQAMDGEIFFGGIKGLNSFFPEQILDNPHIPPVAITAFKKLNRTVQFKQPVYSIQHLFLSRKDYLFSFEFSALDFSIPQKNLYAYKMEGFDPDWIQTPASQRTATYTNLAPGKYIFHVKASNNDYVWNETGASIAITIIPAFWQTIWFRIAVFLIILGISYWIYRRHLENVRLKTELLAAHETQMSIMPQRDPELEGFQVSAVCIPASEIGGDFFDYIWLDEKKIRFGIVIADVSGKAMKAAMNALLTSGMIYSKADEIHSIKDIVTHLNRSLFHKIDRKMFTALCMASIHIQTRELSFVNAGLNELIIKSGKGVEIIKSLGPRFPLGVTRDSTYQEKKKKLDIGDVVLFFTDGLTDIQNSNGRFFGNEGLLKVIEVMDTSRLTASQIKDEIISAVKKFAEGIHLPDDITLVVLKVLDHPMP